MRTLRKYTGFCAKIHSFALIFSFLLIAATPQISVSFAETDTAGTQVLRTSVQAVALEGEFLVQFKTDKTLNEIKKGNMPKWLNKLGKGVSINTQLSDFQVAHIQVANPASTGNWENLANILSSTPDVLDVEPNYIHYATAMPNDPMLSDMWFLDHIKAFDSWDIPHPAKTEDVIVAVLDSGVQFNHEDLKGRIWINRDETPDNGIDDDKNGLIDDMVGWNYYNGNNMPYSALTPAATYTRNKRCTGHPEKKAYEIHGTHVAGSIAAVGNNAKGGTGMARHVKIMPLKVLGGPCGHGGSMGILEAVFYAYQNGAKIINMSLGGTGRSKIAQNIFKQMSDAGVLIIAAAGNAANDNDGPVQNYPASYPAPGILSVAATNPADELAEFSNYGQHSVDLAAPGKDILSTVPGGTTTPPNSTYKQASGTSMATPIVSGAAALLWAHRPELSNLQIKRILMESSDHLNSLRGKIVSGGRLNMQKALTHRLRVAKAPRQAPKQAAQPRNTRSNMGGIRVFDRRSKTNEGIDW